LTGRFVGIAAAAEREALKEIAEDALFPANAQRLARQLGALPTSGISYH